MANSSHTLVHPFTWHAFHPDSRDTTPNPELRQAWLSGLTTLSQADPSQIRDWVKDNSRLEGGTEDKMQSKSGLVSGQFLLGSLQALAQYAVVYDVAQMYRGVQMGETNHQAIPWSMLETESLKDDPKGQYLVGQLARQVVLSLVHLVDEVADPPRITSEVSKTLGVKVFHSGTLRHVMTLGGSVWGETYCGGVAGKSKLAGGSNGHGDPPLSSDSVGTNLRVLCQHIVQKCWEILPLFRHGLRVMGHDWVCRLKAIPATFSSETKDDGTPPSLLHGGYEVVKELTQLVSIITGYPQAACIPFAEQPDLARFVVNLFYQTARSLVVQHKDPIGESTSEIAGVDDGSRTLVLWLTGSLTYLLIVLSGFPQETCLQAWSGLLGSNPSVELSKSTQESALLGTIRPVETLFVKEPGFAGKRLERLTTLLLSIVEATQSSESPQTARNPSLLVLLERRFQLYEWLLEIYEHHPDDTLAYIIKFYETQLAHIHLTADLVNGMENLALAAGTTDRGKAAAGVLDPQLHQALEMYQCMDQEELNRSLAQIEEVVPHFGRGFIKAALALSGYKPDEVIMQLLEERFPEALASLDLQLTVEDLDGLESIDNEVPTEPISDVSEVEAEDPLRHRRNVFDNDEFDIFNRGQVADPNRVYQKPVFPTPDGPSLHEATSRNQLDTDIQDSSYKQAIVERALASLNQLDDEYDDTYDDTLLHHPAEGIATGDMEETLSGSSDQQLIQSTNPILPHEGRLLEYAVSHPEVYQRNRTTRQSALRKELRRITDLSDEQLEGWYIMFQRNPQHTQKLEQYASNQAVRGPSSSTSSADRHRDQRHSATSVKDRPSNRPSSQNVPSPEVQKKSTTKPRGPRANHNRKAQRAKKMRNTLPTDG
ncbi:hypothetical protein IWQ62_004651 [Dispira parvispora]|uniref:CUE domain-containing protein n=1 Tax=Dispira parvispora TaxID=1520584 RepID=A0A9W8ASH4_9FUNG|nr:hypothetical protein IWQ62_004651 [Dispira parvispora]